MTLSTGTKLSHYEITAQIGKGGMGEVYQAKDTKLGRDVAIKVLPEEFAQDADRVARFQREAKLLASLNHPNIASIYGLEESDGINFLVMELVEGNTLDDRIKSGRIPVEEALKLALQIAEALEAAHEKGVIHRDLKPANIKVTPDGKVKVLDFGLAKAFAGEQADLNLSNSPTLSQAATMQGVILGTAAYMSPEQARGKEVDKRADIWAFGVVLFEMLTGEQVFTGDTVSDTLASVLTREPEWQKLPNNLHSRIRLLLERGLQKEPKDRYGAISDARVDIRDVLADPAGVFEQPASMNEPQMRLRTIIPWIIAAIGLTAIIMGLVVWQLRTPAPPELIRFEHTLKGSIQITQPFLSLAVSPDGRKFVYTTNEGLYVRSMNALEAKLISNVKDYEMSPFVSPDGDYVCYLSRVDSQLKKIAINGGALQKICDVEATMSAFWNQDDTVIFYEFGKGLMRVSADGGIPETLIAEKNEYFYTPRILPDGKTLIYTGVTDEGSKVFIQSLESNERKALLIGENAFYLPTGHLAYGLEYEIWVVPFDLDKLEVTGNASRLIEGVSRGPGIAQFAVSDSGTLVYIPEPPASKRTLVWVDMQGEEEPLPFEPRIYNTINLSPDGRKVALTVVTHGDEDVWIIDLVRGDQIPLVDNKFWDFHPHWGSNGQKIFFSSIRNKKYDIYAIEANGSEEDAFVFSEPNRSTYVSSVSTDGKTVIYEIDSGVNSDVAALSTEGEGVSKPLLTKKNMEGNTKISPDGKWLAYESNESRQFEVYVCSFPGGGQRKQVSQNGGLDPLWSPDSREVFYRSGDTIMAASISTKPELNVGIPRILFEDKYALSGSGSGLSWDIDSGGKRFLMAKDYIDSSAEEGDTLPKINVIKNWLEEVKQKVPVP